MAQMALVIRFWHLSLKHHRGSWLGAMVFLNLMAVLAGAQAWLIKPLLDEVHGADELAEIQLLAGALVVVFMARGCAAWIQARCINHAACFAVRDLQGAMLAKLFVVNWERLRAYPGNQLAARFVYDMGRVRDVLMKVVTALARDGVTVLVMVGIVVLHSPLLAGVALALMPLAVLPMLLLARKSKRLAEQGQQQTGGLQARTAESLRALAEVKAARIESREVDVVGSMITKLTDVHQHLMETRLRMEFFLEAVVGVSLAGVIVLGGYLMMEGALSLGGFASFFAAVLMMYQPLRALGKLPLALQEGRVALERVFALLDEPEENTPEHPERAESALPVPQGRIVFDRVSFGYGETPVLTGLSFEVRRGEILGLCGPPGEGKSTVLLLLMRFLTPQQGCVLIDGQDIQDVSSAAVRQAMSWAGQDYGLMERSIADNIAQGALDSAGVARALERAGAHDFVNALPHGADTVLREMGTGLSGGQRQRIALARALYRDTPIILLDEITSAQDRGHCQHIMASLEALKADKTIVLISHSSATLAQCDRVLDMTQT